MSEFFRRLDCSKLKRIPLEEVKRVYYSLYPEVQNSPNRQQLLLDALKNLERQGLLTLPSAGNWEKFGNPPLPNWAALIRETQAAESPEYAKEAWVPELGFWPELKATQLPDAKTINDFLLLRRDSLTLVPIKERSLEIFGDEKHLDALRTGNSIFKGRLPLSAIGAFMVPLPLPYRQAPAPGKPVLVVENHNSFWSFGEWNLSALRYSAVVYGAGEAFRSTGQALDQVLKEVCGEGAEYLGDLDPKGVGIPLDFNRAMTNHGLRVRPALSHYEWLLTKGRTREKSDSQQADADAATSWLGSELGQELAMLWAQGLWIPQEALGFDQLRTLP